MKKTVRIALLLIAAGLCAILIVLCLVRFDVVALMVDAVETETVTIEESFDHIYVESDSFEVSVVPAADGVCRVTCPAGENADFTAMAADGELRIVSTEEKPWLGYISIGIPANDSIRVELPEKAYGALDISCASGNVSVDPDLEFTEAEIDSTSGNIDFRANADKLTLTSTSGEISVSGADLDAVSLQCTSGGISAENLNAGSVAAVSSSGELDLSGIRCKDLRIRTASGSAELTDVIAASTLQAETASGDVRLENSDAGSLNLTTQSGDIRGTLLSPKRFEIAGVGSGRISVPADADGGPCTLKNGSGDIRIEIAD